MWCDDHRYGGSARRSAIGDFDEESMTLSVELQAEDLDEDLLELLGYPKPISDWRGEIVNLTVFARFEVCPTCDGQGCHVNPNIDDCGITGEQFDEDPDFRRDYFAGVFDVPCYECKGKRVVPRIDRGHANPPEIVKAYDDHVDSAIADAAEYRRQVAYGY